MTDDARGNNLAQRLALEFPSSTRWRYLNHAAISPWPTRTRKAVEAFAASNHADGPAGYKDWLRNELSLRKRYAKLIRAGSDKDISLLANTTSGVSLVARGINWANGDNVVMPAGEFPTNQLEWRALKAKGVEIREVQIRGAENPETALLNHFDARTRLLTVSAVQWADGFRLQLQKLGEVCRTADVLFFVDAIQQLGALPLDVINDRIDFLAAGGHKWQMGPEGCGLFYCRPELRENLQPLQLGWRMLETPFAFNDETRPLADGGARYEPGSPNTLGQFALNASLSLQEDFGTDLIASRVLRNAAQLQKGLEAMPGVRVLERESPQRCSGIVSFHPGRRTSKEIVQTLADHRVVCTARGPLVRLSPHFYQSGALLDDALGHIEDVLKL